MYVDWVCKTLDVLLRYLFTSSICTFYSVEEYLKDSSAPISPPCLKQHLLDQCYNEKSIDNPEAMPFFTIEYVGDYLINHKEQDSMREEDWKSFKTGGYKLFKEGHVQNIMVSQQGSIFGTKCNCLLEMKKDRVYKLRLILLPLGLMCAVHNVIVLQVEVRMAVSKRTLWINLIHNIFFPTPKIWPIKFDLVFDSRKDIMLGIEGIKYCKIIPGS